MLQTLIQYPYIFLLYIVALLSAISIHEFAHAWTADHLGDPTPRLQKRLTLNPLSHLELYGLLFLVIAGFGWGKPVVYDPYNLKNPRRDGAVISLAGPISNILLATLFSVVHLLIPSFSFMSLIFIRVNVSLAIFNLLPIHPLDGFGIVEGIISKKNLKSWQKLKKYGMIFLIFLLMPLGNTSLLNAIMRPLTDILMMIFTGRKQI